MFASIPFVQGQLNDIPNLLSTRQFGTDMDDFGTGVAVDTSNSVIFSGYTDGIWPNQAPSGGVDGFIVKHAFDDEEQWTRQFGTSMDDFCIGVALDQENNFYCTGSTDGAFPGQTQYGSFDSFVIKFDSNGEEQWTRQFGTSEFDAAFGVTVDNDGNIYSIGYTGGMFPSQTQYGGYDGFVMKFNPEGAMQWTRQFGTPMDDFATGIGVEVDSSNNLYVSGYTGGDLSDQINHGGYDGFVMKFNPEGAMQWTRQFGDSLVHPWTTL
jgi:hypothetical protein